MTTTEDLLYLEAEGSCAACGIRDVRVLTVHHLDKAEPKDESYDNKLILCHNCHHSHHNNKGLSGVQLREIKRRLIIKMLTQPGLNALKEAYRHGIVFALPFLVNHLVEFGYMVIGEERSYWEEGDEKRIIEAQYSLSPEGKRLLEKWELK